MQNRLNDVLAERREPEPIANVGVGNKTECVQVFRDRISRGLQSRYPAVRKCLAMLAEEVHDLFKCPRFR